jgi:predicted Zn-dependent peptidase
MGLEGNAAVADMMGLQMILTGRVRTLQESLQKIDEVSVQDVVETAQSYLHKDSIKLAMIGPFEQDKKQEFEKLMEI